MSRWELYGTWALLVIIGLGISSVSRHLSDIERQIKEIRRKLGERSE